MISIVLVLCVAIVHKTYWVTTTETNPEDIWANKQLTKDGNNWTITFQEERSAFSLASSQITSRHLTI